MEKFGELFITLTREDGRNIGVDPFNHLTIPGVAFEGVYMKYFLPEKKLYMYRNQQKTLTLSNKFSGLNMS